MIAGAVDVQRGHVQEHHPARITHLRRVFSLRGSLSVASKVDPGRGHGVGVPLIPARGADHHVCMTASFVLGEGAGALGTDAF